MRFLPKARHAQKIGVSPFFKVGEWAVGVGVASPSQLLEYLNFPPLLNTFLVIPPPFLTPFVRLLHSTSEINVPT